MILGNDYDAILNKLFYVADKAPMYNGDDVFKYMKTMEKMTLAFWLFAYREADVMTIGEQKRSVKSFEDELSKRLHIPFIGIKRANNHCMIAWRQRFYLRLFNSNFNNSDLLEYLTECLTSIEKDEVYLVDYHPSSISANYKHRTKIEAEAAEFIDALVDCIN